jgi:hypothetical protein
MSIQKTKRWCDDIHDHTHLDIWVTTSCFIIILMISTNHTNKIQNTN